MHYKPIVGAALGNVLRSYLLSMGHISLFGDLSVFSDSHDVQRVVKAFTVLLPCRVLRLFLTWRSHEVTSRFTFFTARCNLNADSQKRNEKVVPFKRTSVLKSQTDKRQQGALRALRVLITQTQEIADQSDAKN